MTYKQIIRMLAHATNKEHIDEACAEINRAFENGKITAEDHETLYTLACNISVKD